MATYSSIYEHFWAATAPVGPFALWPWINVDDDCRSCPKWGTYTLAQLAEDYLEQDLISSGIAKALPDGLVMNPALLGSDNYVFMLRRADGEPYGLLTTAGSIPFEQLAILTSLKDRRTYDCAIEHRGTLFVAFTIADFLFLRGCGFPVTLASGLEYLTNAEFDQLYEACHWDHELSETQIEVDECESESDDIESADNETDGAENVESDADEFANELRHIASLLGPIEIESVDAELIELILVGWSPARMLAEEPAALRLVRARLLGFERFLDADVSRIAVWWPSSYEMEVFEFCRAAQSVAELIIALRKSAEASRFNLEHTTASTDRSRIPPNFQEALATLNKLLDEPAGSHSEQQLAKARADYKRAVEADLIQPMINDGMASGDPTQQILSVVAADYARILHCCLPFELFAAKGSACGAFDGPSAQNGLSNVESLGKLADRMLKYMRELRQ